MIGDKRGKDCDIPVICINDKAKPAEIPDSKWIKEGEKYTIVEFMKINLQGGILGVRLAEIDLTDCFPYQYFNANRFGLPVEDQELNEVLDNIIKEIEEEYVVIPV